MKSKKDFNEKFGKWKTNAYGRKRNERTGMEKVSKVREEIRRRVASVLRMRRQADKTKKTKGKKS